VTLSLAVSFFCFTRAQIDLAHFECAVLPLLLRRRRLCDVLPSSTFFERANEMEKEENEEYARTKGMHDVAYLNVNIVFSLNIGKEEKRGDDDEEEEEGRREYLNENTKTAVGTVSMLLAEVSEKNVQDEHTLTPFTRIDKARGSVLERVSDDDLQETEKHRNDSMTNS
jgi:hypothetical protein